MSFPLEEEIDRYYQIDQQRQVYQSGVRNKEARSDGHMKINSNEPAAVKGAIAAKSPTDGQNPTKNSGRKSEIQSRKRKRYGITSNQF